jgi:hypothetical protein
MDIEYMFKLLAFRMMIESIVSYQLSGPLPETPLDFKFNAFSRKTRFLSIFN